MAFGREMQDFVAAFKTGYNMFDSPEERAEKKEDREWKREDRQRRQDEIDYQHGRDAAADKYRDRVLENSERRQGAADERANQSAAETARHNRAIERRAIEGGWRKQFDPAENNRQDDWLERNGVPGAVPDGGSAPTYRDPQVSAPEEAPAEAPEDDTSDEQSAIPTDGAMQLASYNPDPKARSSTGGLDTSHFSREDMSGPEIAYNLTNDLSKYYGLPQYVSQGIVGSLAAETSGFSQMQEQAPTVPGSRGGYGYSQWTGPRRDDFEAYAGGKPNEYGANFGNLVRELDGSEGGVLDRLKTARNAQEAMQIFTNDFLRPGKPNWAGRRDWTNKVGTVIGAPRNAINASVGGPVTAIPDDSELQDEVDRTSPTLTASADDGVARSQVQVASNRPLDTRNDATPQQAIPDNVPTPTPRPEYGGDGVSQDEDDEPTNDPYEQGRRAVREGLKQALARSGVTDSAVDDPDTEKAHTAYMMGYGAAPQQMMRKVLDRIDPDHKMSPGERNIKAVGTVYRYYADQGDFKSAKEAAADMVQFYRQQSQQFAALSQAALQNGDYDNAVKAAVAAYTNIPNGRDLKVTKQGNGYLVEVTDPEGKHVTKQVVSPEQMAAAAMNFNPTTFDEEILNAAGYKPDTEKPPSAEAMGNIEQGTKAYFAENAEGADPKDVQTISSLANSIAAHGSNEMGPEEASQFAQKLASMNADDKYDTSKRYSVSKIPNTPDVRVTVDGQTVRMSKNALAKLEAMHGEKSAGRMKQKESDMVQEAKDKENAKFYASKTKEVYEGFKKSMAGGTPEQKAARQADANAGQAGADIGGMFTPGAKAIPDTVRPVEPDPRKAGPEGQFGPGNIDLENRPQVPDPDGGTATVKSMSFQDEDGKETLIPMVAEDGKSILNEQQAIEQYRRTGHYLGKFNSPEEADAYAEKLHSQQGAYYGMDDQEALPTHTGQGIARDKERFDAVQTLLAQKDQLSKSNDPRAQRMVQQIDDKLRSLGYEVK